ATRRRWSSTPPRSSPREREAGGSPPARADPEPARSAGAWSRVPGRGEERRGGRGGGGRAGTGAFPLSGAWSRTGGDASAAGGGGGVGGGGGEGGGRDPKRFHFLRHEIAREGMRPRPASALAGRPRRERRRWARRSVHKSAGRIAVRQAFPDPAPSIPLAGLLGDEAEGADEALPRGSLRIAGCERELPDPERLSGLRLRREVEDGVPPAGVAPPERLQQVGGDDDARAGEEVRRADLVLVGDRNGAGV